jgi:S1-C subfamily serine protease/regulator of sirC expression with transglutaminase-like and TPR domain
MLRIFALMVGLLAAVPAAFASAASDCESDNHPVAIRACTQLLQRDPRNAVLYLNRGISYRETGRLKEALSDFNRAIQHNPRYTQAYVLRGNLYLRSRDNRRAIQDYERAVSLDPGHARAHNNRGEALENLNELDAAMEAYSRAIDIEPRFALAYANRGDIWRKMGNKENAANDYRHALTIEPNLNLAVAGLKLLGLAPTAAAPVTRPPDPRRVPDQARLPEQRGPQPVGTDHRGGQQQVARPTDPAPREKRSSSGTGFFVSSHGYVLTNNHVVDGCRNFAVAQAGFVTQRARVVANDSKNDLALLQTELKPGAVPNMRLGARLGENVFVYGFPLTGLLASTGNFTIGNVTATAGLGDDTTLIQMSAPVQPGNSGGPVIDQFGNVVAVVVSKLNALRIAKLTSGDIPQNVNFAIKSLIAMSFLEANNIGITPAGAAGTALETTQIAERARQFTVQIACTN